jgi:hypothetical protein
METQAGRVGGDQLAPPEKAEGVPLLRNYKRSWVTLRNVHSNHMETTWPGTYTTG